MTISNRQNRFQRSNKYCYTCYTSSKKNTKVRTSLVPFVELLKCWAKFLICFTFNHTRKNVVPNSCLIGKTGFRSLSSTQDPAYTPWLSQDPNWRVKTEDPRPTPRPETQTQEQGTRLKTRDSRFRFSKEQFKEQDAEVKLTKRSWDPGCFNPNWSYCQY